MSLAERRYIATSLAQTIDDGTHHHYIPPPIPQYLPSHDLDQGEARKSINTTTILPPSSLLTPQLSSCLLKSIIDLFMFSILFVRTKTCFTKSSWSNVSCRAVRCVVSKKIISSSRHGLCWTWNQDLENIVYPLPMRGHPCFTLKIVWCGRIE